MNDTIKNKIKKEENKMKKTILTTVLIITALFIFSAVSHAQGSNHSGWYNGMASVAEKEIKTNEQNATENIAAEIKVANTEKGYLSTSEEADLVEKTDEVEN
jgi:site-specific DNA-adenine methylase